MSSLFASLLVLCCMSATVSSQGFNFMIGCKDNIQSTSDFNQDVISSIVNSEPYKMVAYRSTKEDDHKCQELVLNSGGSYTYKYTTSSGSRSARGTFVVNEWSKTQKATLQLSGISRGLLGERGRQAILYPVLITEGLHVYYTCSRAFGSTLPNVYAFLPMGGDEPSFEDLKKTLTENKISVDGVKDAREDCPSSGTE